MSGFYSPKPSRVDQEAARALLAHPVPSRIEFHSGGQARAFVRDKADNAVFTGMNIPKACLIVRAVNYAAEAQAIIAKR